MINHRWAFGLLAVIAGCTANVDPTVARKYPCSGDGGPEECPGGWVCGLEHVCHPQEPGAWQCRTDADCFGWHCGLGGMCYDRAEAVARPCDFALERDGGRGDCPIGWACGRENTCHAPAPGPYSCANDAECFGWHCGLQGSCYDLDAGHAWSCDHAQESSGARADCPVSWGCGLDNVCHAAVPGPYACLSSADCYGWHCGLQGTCYDLDAGRPWPCDRGAELDGGRADCPTGWACGLLGSCHPAAPSPYPCESNADCYGWHCGLQNTCYDLDAGHAWPCDHVEELAGTRADCPTGWRCGLENACHDRAAPAAYACGSDFDCEQGWRCGPTGTCLDPSGEVAAVLHGTVGVERVSPQLFDRRPDLFSGDREQGVTWTFGNRLTRLTPDPKKKLQTSGYWVVTSTTLPSAPAKLIEAGGVSFVQFTDGSVVRVEWSAADGGAVQVPISTPLPPDVRLRYLELFGGSYHGYPMVAAWSGAQIWALYPDAGAQPLDVVPGGAVLDLGTYNGNLLALTDGGISVRPVTSSFGMTGAWAPLPVLWTDGGVVSPTEFRPATILSAGSGWLELASVDAGAVLLAPINNGVTAATVFQDRSAAPCPASLQFVSLEDSSPPFPSVRCRGSTGDFLFRLSIPGPPTLVDPAVLTTTEVPENVMHATAHGAIGEPLVGGSSVFGPMSIVYGGRATPAGVPTGFELGATWLLSDPVSGVYPTNVPFVVQPGIGVAAITNVVRNGSTNPYPSNPWSNLTNSFALTLGRVRGAPSWLFTGGVFDVGPLLDFPSHKVAALPDLTGVASVDDVSRDSALLITTANPPVPSGTQITAVGGWVAAAVVSTKLDGGVAPLVPRLSPFGGIPISALALVPARPDSGVLAEGYALSSSGLAGLTAYSASSWSQATLSLPPGDWLDLIRDSRHVRVAYRDGRIYSLPSRLPLAEPLPPPLQAFSAAHVDGVDLLATDGGVFGLTANPDGGGTGVWRPIPLPPSSTDPLAAGDDFATDAQLFEGAHRAFLVTRWGTVYRITVDGGTP